jgi:hypothetical protein
VRDQLTLRVYGAHPMKILFDERTQVYRDGQRVSLRALKPEEHASVQTTLDGTKVFALSIHMLSHSSQATYEGRVVDFDASSGELTVASGQSRQTLKVLVQGNTAFIHKGQVTSTEAQAGPADLVGGTLVGVEFVTEGKDDPVASRVTILAVPGATFVFSGNVSFLDVHAGVLTLVDPRDDKSYQVAFDPSLSSAQGLRIGDDIRVVARYDGTRYTATELGRN